MRLKHLFIGDYENLKNFSLDFDGDSFIDIFVGKNGSGKSNLLEATIEIFRHLYEHSHNKTLTIFDYTVVYDIDDAETKITWQNDLFFINNKPNGQKTLGKTVALPENVLIYYSGHNDTITNLVKRYEADFSRRIKGASVKESRRFLGVGSDYKALLLVTLFLQTNSSRARQTIFKRLGIKSTDPIVQIELNRPKFADGRLKELKVTAIDPFDPRTHYWGADGITRDFLDKLISCIKGEFSHNNIYVRDTDQYRIPVNIELFQEKFADIDITEQFRLLDNLKILGMFGIIDLGITLSDDQPVRLNHFSDGQFQSVYIYSIVELFKNRNCITLLDEPDSFLHPEWQFDFLKQVFEITEEAAKSNHVLMCSHSASTIAMTNDSIINLFEFDNGNVVVNKVKKFDVIKSLSAGLISFTEGEARLNIHHILKSTTGPVLFTEGITDEMILEVAWEKLYPGEECIFVIQNAFDRIFLRNLFSREELRTNHPDRIMFALFDFDEAYDDWNGLNGKINGQLEESDPYKGIAKQLKCENHYAMLLPVPNSSAIKPQVLDNDGKPWGRGSDSYLSIELLFYRNDWLGQWFKKRSMPGGGEIIEFSGDKVAFAKEQVPTIDTQHFEIFRPIFEFIQSKCGN